ncbi:MAG: hypothetical protein ABFS46_10005, partial [Myxococcota bacterium]
MGVAYRLCGWPQPEVATGPWSDIPLARGWCEGFNGPREAPHPRGLRREMITRRRVYLELRDDEVPEASRQLE